MTKLRRLPLFYKALLIYSAVLVLAALAALAVLYAYLGAYEASRPNSCISAYTSRAADELPQPCLDALEGLDPSIKTPEENRHYLTGLFSGAEYSRLRLPDLAENECAFAISAGGVQFGTVYMEQAGKGSFGLIPWNICREEYDLSPFIHRAEIALPEGYAPVVNGVELGGEHIRTRDREFVCLSQCYEDYENLPYLQEYDSGSYLGEAEFKVKTPSGSLIDPAEADEALFLNNCPEADRQRVSVFSVELISKYVTFCADVGGNSGWNYSQLEPLVDHRGPFYSRIRKAFGSFGYSNTRSCEILDMTVNICSDLGEGRYFVDASYVTEILGNSSPVKVDNNVRIILTETNGVLLAQALYNY